LTSEGLIAIAAMTALPLNSFQRKVSLNTLGHRTGSSPTQHQLLYQTFNFVLQASTRT
jgi:hypothetical protein